MSNIMFVDDSMSMPRLRSEARLAGVKPGRTKASAVTAINTEMSHRAAMRVRDKAIALHEKYAEQKLTEDEATDELLRFAWKNGFLGHWVQIDEYLQGFTKYSKEFFWLVRRVRNHPRRFRSLTVLKGEELLFNRYCPIMEKIVPWSGSAVIVDEERGGVHVCYLEGHHSRNDFVPFHDILAVADPKGEHMTFGVYSGKSRTEGGPIGRTEA